MAKPVLISGGGLAALLLGRYLLRSRIPFLLFERDSSLVFRAQGYRLRLSSEGLDAIEEALGPEGFATFWNVCSKTGGPKGLGIIDAITGQTLTDDREPTESKAQRVPESRKEALASRDGKVIGISRGDMRSLFMEGCEQYVRFSHHVTGYERTASGVHVIFKDGSKSVEGSLLVGGEGIYSKVAKQLSNGKLKTFDTGSRGIHGQAPTTAFKGLGEGVWRVIDETPDGDLSIITNVRPEDMNDPAVMFGWTMSATAKVIQPPNDDYSILGEPAAHLAQKLTSKWHPRVKPMFDDMNVKEAAFWKVTCSSPSGVPQWENDPRVTVIGDAVHSMTPVGGNGANTAVRDSALLGRLLAKAGGYAEGITLTYEKEMRAYASEQVAASYGQLAALGKAFIDEESSPVVG